MTRIPFKRNGLLPKNKRPSKKTHGTPRKPRAARNAETNGGIDPRLGTALTIDDALSEADR